MRATDRVKASRLESIMARHRSAERRTLADLHSAGFRFETIGRAEAWLRAQRTLAGLTQEQIEVAIRAAENREMK